MTIGAVNNSGAPEAPKNDPEKILGAAKQFEALMISQMLKSMQDSKGGFMGMEEDQSGAAAMEYGQEAFAQAMSAAGGLGLARMVAQGLQQPAGK